MVTLNYVWPLVGGHITHLMSQSLLLEEEILSDASTYEYSEFTQHFYKAMNAPKGADNHSPLERGAPRLHSMAVCCSLHPLPFGNLKYSSETP